MSEKPKYSWKAATSSISERKKESAEKGGIIAPTFYHEYREKLPWVPGERRVLPSATGGR